MKVFGCPRQGEYAGGLILVASNSLEEAYNTYMQDEFYSAFHAELDGEEMYNYYPLEKWFEFTELTANCNETKIICEHGYSD
jgi:hypothetical protein